jgi:hypothetical protein
VAVAATEFPLIAVWCGQRGTAHTPRNVYARPSQYWRSVLNASRKAAIRLSVSEDSTGLRNGHS